MPHLSACNRIALNTWAMIIDSLRNSFPRSSFPRKAKKKSLSNSESGVVRKIAEKSSKNNILLISNVCGARSSAKPVPHIFFSARREENKSGRKRIKVCCSVIFTIMSTIIRTSTWAWIAFYFSSNKLVRVLNFWLHTFTLLIHSSSRFYKRCLLVIRSTVSRHRSSNSRARL